MDQTSSHRDPRTDETRTIFFTDDIGSAEFIQLILLGFDIRAAAWKGDPLACGMVAFEVLVMSVDHERAQHALEESMIVSQRDEWMCPECDEPVPAHFDICWNCETLHPELVAENEMIESDAPQQVVKVN